MISFGVGYLWEDPWGAETQAATRAQAARMAAARQSAAGLDAAKKTDARDEAQGAGRAPNDAGGLAPADARLRMFEILSKTNRFERYRDISAFTAHITKENWREVLEAFAVQRRTEGRKYNGTAELHMVLERIGELAGQEALNQYAAMGDDDTREICKYVAQAWSKKDPQAAVAWYQQLPPAKQQQVHDGMMASLIHTNLPEAVELAMQGTVPMQQSDAGVIMKVALKEQGFDAAEKLLAGVEQRSEMADASKGSLFLKLAQRKIKDAAAAGDPFRALDWYGQYVGKTYMGPGSTSLVMLSAAASDPGKALRWLQSQGAALTPTQRDAAYPALARGWQQQSADGLANWLTAHSEDPQHDKMAAAVAQQQIASGQVTDAQRWTSMVADPVMQARLNDLASKAAQKIQLQQQQQAPAP